MTAYDINDTEQRRERRLNISSVILPFLGSREDEHCPFQYLLNDLSMHGGRICIPHWLVMREHLVPGDRLDVHVPFQFGGKTYSNCTVAWTMWDEEIQGQVCGIDFKERQTPLYPVFISFEEQEVSVDLTRFPSEEGLVVKVLRDSLALKRGISIYLRKLGPYLSRKARMPKSDYEFLRSFLIEDEMFHVRRNIECLSGLYDAVRYNGHSTGHSVPDCLTPEDYLDVFKPEIPEDVFLMAFGEAVSSYLHAIKVSEKKLYTSYNALQMLYIRTLHEQQFR